MSSKKEKKFYKIIKILIIMFLNFILLSSCLLVDFFSDQDEYQKQLDEWKLWLYGKSKVIKTPVIHQIYDRNGVLIGEFKPFIGTYISMDRCKKMEWLNKATVISEDKDFYKHGGINYTAILRAFVVNLMKMSFSQGGSTITQQLAKNLFTGKEKTIQRKILETILAKKIESQFNKDEILCLYLNKIYMGGGRYGAEEASWYYFNKPPEKLTPAEASVIVGLYPNPEKYNPLSNLNLSLKKQEIVLKKLVEANYIDEKRMQDEINYFIKYYKINLEQNETGRLAQFGANRYFSLNKSPASNEYVKDFLLNSNIVPKEQVMEQSLKIYTTIDLNSQEIAEESMTNYLKDLRKKNLEKYNQYNIDSSLIKGIEGVLVSIDIPTGHIRSLVGGYQIYETGILNYRIFNMKRQVGSTIKGFLYAVALHKNILKVNDKVVDEPIDISGYKPKNWYKDFLGEITLKQAIARSVNTVAVKTLNDMGIDDFRNELIQSLGMSFYEGNERFPKNLSIALGSFELTPLELTLLYSAILNQGYKITPILIQKIERQDGVVIYEDMTTQTDVSIISYEASAGALELLRSVLDQEEDGTAGWIGSLRKKNKNYLPYDIAGKSGTTQFPDELKKRYNDIQGVIRDSWFVGIIPTNVTTIWIGHDKGAPISGAMASSVWASYTSSVFRDPMPQSFPELKQEEVIDYITNKKSSDFQ